MEIIKVMEYPNHITYDCLIDGGNIEQFTWGKDVSAETAQLEMARMCELKIAQLTETVVDVAIMGE